MPVPAAVNGKTQRDCILAPKRQWAKNDAGMRLSCSGGEAKSAR